MKLLKFLINLFKSKLFTADYAKFKLASIAIAFLLPITWAWFAPDISLGYKMAFTLIPVGLLIWLKIKHG